MIRQLTVDVNRVVEGSMIRSNAGRAVTFADLEVGQTIVVGDRGWGVVQAEVVELDRASGSTVLRVIG